MSERMFAIIGSELNVKPKQVQAAVELLDEGNTVPFIARYRKEVTGELQDEQLRTIEERIKYLRNLETRRQEIIASITNSCAISKGSPDVTVSLIIISANGSNPRSRAIMARVRFLGRYGK